MQPLLKEADRYQSRLAVVNSVVNLDGGAQEIKLVDPLERRSTPGDVPCVFLRVVADLHE